MCRCVDIYVDDEEADRVRFTNPNEGHVEFVSEGIFSCVGEKVFVYATSIELSLLYLDRLN
jgi:hypothetical protein